MQILADECCPRAVVDALRVAGIDVRYAAETDSRSPDTDLLRLANDEARIIVTEDFDFGDLLFRDRLPSLGAIILFLPELGPGERAKRLLDVVNSSQLDFANKLTIVEKRRVRQRELPG